MILNSLKFNNLWKFWSKKENMSHQRKYKIQLIENFLVEDIKKKLKVSKN